MNDRFKFRAWDERKKILHYDFQFITSQPMEGWICFSSDKEPRKAGENSIIFDNPYSQAQIKIMQCTGEKDSTETLIFESDIATGQQRGQFGETMDDYTGIVEFKDGCFMLKYEMSRFEGHKRIGSDLLCNFKNLKILGNIYENPELLGGD